MVIGAVSRDSGTRVCCGAPGESVSNGRTSTTVVVGGATFRDSDASATSTTPRETSGGASAVTAVIVVTGAVDGDTDA